MTAGAHKVAIRVGGMLIENWSEYEIESDILTPADGFSVQLGPLDPADGKFGAVYDAVKPDAEVQVTIDDVVVMTGFVDKRHATLGADTNTLTVSGRDKGGRLVDESMPLFSFAGLGIEDLAKKAIGPWFDGVVLSNATNRRLMAGHGKGAKTGRAAGEPIVPRTGNWNRKVEPGESRWAVLEHFLREAGLLAWATADGKHLFVGKPNYAQEPSYFFLHPKAGSPRAAGGNVLSMEIADDCTNRYSQVVAVGAHAGDAINYAERVTKRRGVSSNGPKEYGVGADFAHRKVLLVADDAIKDGFQANERARREMAERDASKLEINLQTYGHGQMSPTAGHTTLFAADTVAAVEDEVTGLRGRYYITSVRMHKSQAGGELTDIKLVPLNAELRA